MNRFLFSVSAVLGASLPLILDSTLKGAALLALAALCAITLGKASAATRHLVWLVAVVALLFVPVLSVALPQWRVLPVVWERPPVKLAGADRSYKSYKTYGTDRIDQADQADTAGGGALVHGSAPASGAPAATEIQQPIVAVEPSLPVAESPARRPSLGWLALLWGGGFGLLILRLLAAHLLLRRGARGCMAPAADEPMMAEFATAAAEMDLRREVILLLDERRTIPVVWGVLRPHLLLPAEARNWSPEQRRSVFLHELAHLRRRDPLVQWLTQLACALHWWNPLVWLAAWRIHIERERACDDLVLASGVRPSAYAEHLLDVATRLAPARWTQSCGLAMARKSSLEGRLLAVLSEKLNRRRVTTALAALALVLGAGIAVPVAMLRAADEEWDYPHGAHVGGNDFSAFCVHDGKDATYVIAYHGDFDSTSRSSSNAKARTWTDSVTLTAKKPGIALSFHRTHTAPGKLSITTAPAEGRDLSKPAPPPRDFGQKEYDLAQGRVFLLSDSGMVRQLDIATPLVTDQESAKELAALIAAVPPQDRADVAPPRNVIGQLEPETIARLQWGEPVNGLRLALAWPPALNDALLGKEPIFELVVQNVTEHAVHFLASDEAPNPRKMLIREGESIVQALSDPEVSAADWKLAPGECGVLRLLTNEERDPDGAIPSSAIESDLSKIGRYHAIVRMEITKAPPGAWTGMLVTGQTRGSADAADAPAPKHEDARALYEIWQQHARANGDIPGALIGELAAAVRTFIGYNPTWETVPKLNELLPRLDATRDWTAADAIALLDEIATVQDSPVVAAAERATRHTIRQGTPLPETFSDAAWGEAAPNGLRAAWVLEPGRAEHRFGDALRVRLLVQNSGTVNAVLQVPTWHQGEVKASDANGAEVEVSGISWTTLARLVPVRLAPGEFIEINTPGVGLGPRAGMGPWAGPRVGSNVLAKPGVELTLTHGPVPLDGSDVGVREDDPHVAGPGWWPAHIKARLARELPLPADAAERTRLLDLAVRELFATAPTAEETAAFTGDQTPDALDALVERLAARADVVEFSGKLPTSPATFRVLAADPNADKMPRVVLGPGEYPLPTASAERGDATLKIVGRPVGERRTNDAQLIFETTEFTGKLPPDPHKLEVPDGWGTWAIVCRPSDGFLYLLHKGGVRKIDYSAPRKVTDIPVNDLPAEFRDEVKRQFDIHEISAEQQAKIFEKPAPPADTPDPAAAPLPDTAYAKSGIPLDELGKAIAWSGAESIGLRLGIHIPDDAVWRIGGEVKAEVWAHNAGEIDVKFSRSTRTDVGLSIIATGADGKKHFADITQFRGRPSYTRMLLLSPARHRKGEFRGRPSYTRMLLPVGNVVKLKEFTMNLGAKKDGERVNLDLPPGDYKLSAVWSDTTSRVVPEGEWSAKLTTGEIGFNIPAANAGADTGKPTPNPPGANIVKLPDHQSVKSGIPADPDAAEAPRSANGPGRFVVGDNAHLLVSQTTEGDQRTNKAVIAFLSPDPNDASPHKPHEIALPDGIGTYGLCGIAFQASCGSCSRISCGISTSRTLHKWRRRASSSASSRAASSSFPRPCRTRCGRRLMSPVRRCSSGKTVRRDPACDSNPPRCRN